MKMVKFLTFVLSTSLFLNLSVRAEETKKILDEEEIKIAEILNDEEVTKEVAKVVEEIVEEVAKAEGFEFDIKRSFEENKTAYISSAAALLAAFAGLAATAYFTKGKYWGKKGLVLDEDTPADDDHRDFIDEGEAQQIGSTGRPEGEAE